MPDTTAQPIEQPDTAAPALRLIARPAGARTEQPSVSTRRRWARIAEAEAAGREAAHADGVRQGYLQG